MWLSSNKSKSSNVSEGLLSELKSNGVELSIDELIIYQNKASLIKLNGSRQLHGHMSGNYLARSKGRGMEFDEVRHYQTGDDIRTIDWRVTARTGKTHTKLFREEIERPVIIATDLTRSMLFGSKLLFKSVQASHLAALISWHTKQRGDRLGGIVFNDHTHTELKPRSRKHGVLHYLHALATCHQSSLQASAKAQPSIEQSDQSFAENCLRLRQVSRPGSMVYLLTDGHNICQDAIRHLANINRHCELVICLISDPMEHSLPTVDSKQNVAITDGSTNQTLTLGDKSTEAKYREQAHAFISNKEAMLLKTGARVIHFDAGQSLEEQLKDGVASWIR